MRQAHDEYNFGDLSRGWLLQEILVRSLEELYRLKKKIRVIGFDDAPFERASGSPVKIVGVVCSDTRFEGMLWGEVSKDGTDATRVLVNLLQTSKFYEQINIVLIDGIAFGGFNIIDLSQLSGVLKRPCVAVMRKYPDIQAVKKALKNFNDYSQRNQLITRAGTIYEGGGFCYQVRGCRAEVAAHVLQQLTDTGHVPEALRLAHLIGAAVISGESSNRA